jgi:hypothetical protein
LNKLDTLTAINEQEELGNHFLADKEKKELICGIKCRSRGKRRFFPLIVNDEHGDSAYDLLCEEIIRSDQLSDHEYESPIDLNPPPLHSSPSMNKEGEIMTAAPSSSPSSSSHSYHLKPLSSSTIQLPLFNGSIALRVISAVMNSMVVMFSTNADQGKLSDPALVGTYPPSQLM